MNTILKLILATLAVLITDLLLPGVTIGHMDSWQGVLTALLVAAVLGLLNTIVRPILIILTLPVTLLTLGLFILVINASLVMLAATLINGFEVQGFWWALGFSVVQWLVQGFLNALDGGKKPSGRP
ncbi:MAG: phage holin family protein [Flavobacteriales bacterium]|nr:phage holin family protein [Flavobacteriales bacterium]MCB9166412.1 phage holin family protein [Flavobacteriales bacterium]